MTTARRSGRTGEPVPVSRTVLLVGNPAAGRGRALHSTASLVRALRDNGFQVHEPALRSAEDVRAAIAAAVAEGADAVVVLGGDGICHLAVNELAGSDTALGIVPAGTGNDLAAALGIPTDPDGAARQVLACLREGVRRRIDLGRATLRGSSSNRGYGNDSRAGERWWATVLCAGFDSAVNDRANRMRWPHGPRRYDLALLIELARLTPTSVRIEADGEAWTQEVTLIAIGNTRSYGGGIPICPAADPTDGRFDVTVVGRVSRAELIRVLPALRRGNHAAHPAVRTVRARRLRLAAPSGGSPAGTGHPREVIAYADGEPVGPLPLEVEVVPGAVSILARTPGD